MFYRSTGLIWTGTALFIIAAVVVWTSKSIFVPPDGAGGLGVIALMAGVSASCALLGAGAACWIIAWRQARQRRRLDAQMRAISMCIGRLSSSGFVIAEMSDAEPYDSISIAMGDALMYAATHMAKTLDAAKDMKEPEDMVDTRELHQRLRRRAAVHRREFELTPASKRTTGMGATIRGRRARGKSSTIYY